MHGPKTDLKLIQTTTKKKLLCSKNLCWTKIEEKCKKNRAKMVQNILRNESRARGC
jgi:hypothetical protein